MANSLLCHESSKKDNREAEIARKKERDRDLHRKQERERKRERERGWSDRRHSRLSSRGRGDVLACSRRRSSESGADNDHGDDDVGGERTRCTTSTRCRGCCCCYCCCARARRSMHQAHRNPATSARSSRLASALAGGCFTEFTGSLVGEVGG